MGTDEKNTLSHDTILRGSGAATGLDTPLVHRWKHFFDEQAIECLGFLERRIMRRCLKPHESLAGCTNRRKIVRG